MSSMRKTGKPILPPFVIKQVNGIRMAFIGAVLKETPDDRHTERRCRD
jgi:2',3'-cyclic-nucleotide 2'-phosphodiesterase (5'-nucleotidase family)